MVSFEEAGAMLDEAADALPKEIFENLNGGVNLLPARRTDDDGLLTMGMYFSDQMGRHIEIYYGSFCEAFPDAPPETCRRELARTLKHELTHHLENQAFDRSLEVWDDAHRQELLSQLYDEPFRARSILFVSGGDDALGPMAEALFRLAAAKDCPQVRTASAGLAETPPAHVQEKAARAAAGYGADLSQYTPRRVTRELLEAHEAVLCMTGEECEELALQFPAFDARIMCLGEKDLTPPALGTQGGWNRTADKVAEEIDALVDELCGEDGHGDP